LATEEHVYEALRLFHVSTMDAARSGITANLVVTPEMRAEIQVTHQHTFLLHFLNFTNDPYQEPYLVLNPQVFLIMSFHSEVC
jgi:hypothetical protein